MNKDNEPLCVMCDEPLPYGQRKYCSKVCKVCNIAHYCNEKCGTKFNIEYINNTGGR